MSTNAPKLPSVNLDDADRAASSIRPSWEHEDAGFDAPSAAAASDRTAVSDKASATVMAATPATVRSKL